MKKTSRIVKRTRKASSEQIAEDRAEALRIHEWKQFVEVVRDISEDVNFRTKLKGFIELILKPTPEQVDAEVDRLEKLSRSVFNNPAVFDAIKAQIVVLSGRLTLDEAREEFEEGGSMDAVCDALEWMDGSPWITHTVNPPSVGWAEVLDHAVEQAA